MIVQCNNVVFGYRKQTAALKGVSFGMNAGEFVLVVGHNGAGKSTLLKLLNGILKPTSGTVRVFGFETSVGTAELAKHISITFQNPSNQLFASTVAKEVEFGPRNLGKSNYRELGELALTLFDFLSLAHRHPYDLLPPQRKLLTVASAVATEARLLAFDEPTTGLSQRELLILRKVFRRLSDQQRSFIVVSHHLEFFLPMATRILVFSEGSLVYDGQREEFMSEERRLRRFGLRLPLIDRLNRILR